MDIKLEMTPSLLRHTMKLGRTAEEQPVRGSEVGGELPYLHLSAFACHCSLPMLLRIDHRQVYKYKHAQEDPSVECYVNDN